MKNETVLDNDFWLGLALFIVVMTLLVVVGSLILHQIDATSQKHREHTEACRGLEDAAERTLCLTS